MDQAEFLDVFNPVHDLRAAMFRVNQIFTTFRYVILLASLLFINSVQLLGQNSTETFDDRTVLDELNESLLFSEGLNDSVAFSSSNSTLFPVPDNSTENVIELDNATDILNQTDAVTFPPLETERHINVWLHHNETFCSCDLLIESCDVNCCCDSDCTDEDIGAFPECYSTSSVPESEYCFDSDIVLRNNTPYKMIINEAKSLFCVIHDNFQERLKYRDVPSFSSIQQFERLYAMDVYSWSNNFKVDESVTSQVMKAGDPLYRTASLSSIDVLVKWRLPSSCFTTLCECGKDVLYMEGVETSCARSFSNTEEACEENSALSANYFQRFCVLSETNLYPNNDDATDITTIESTTETTSRVEEKRKCISKSDVPVPYFDHSDKVCVNAVQSVQYIVSHDGTLGITDIKHHFRYRNISAGESVFTQHFSVIFEWNSTNSNKFKRSGNPGYQIGFPVLVGTESDEVSDTIKISESGLTVMGKDSLGFCTHERKTVYFGQNAKSGCYMPGIFTDCEHFQKEIKAVLGINDASVYVGSFGNADPQNSAEWLKVFLEESAQGSQRKEDSLCNDNLITGLIIDIAYAAVGLIENPQYKIVGTVFRYVKTPDVHLNFQDGYHHDGLSDHFYSNTVEISTSVTFYDVTETAIPAYAQLPVLRTKLPHDFFYPFLRL